MLGAFSKATNNSFQKGMTFCRSIYVKKVMKLLAFIFEQSLYQVEIKLPFRNDNVFVLKVLSISFNSKKNC